MSCVAYATITDLLSIGLDDLDIRQRKAYKTLHISIKFDEDVNRLIIFW